MPVHISSLISTNFAMPDVQKPPARGKGQPTAAASSDADELYAWGSANNFATVILPRPGGAAASFADRSSHESGHDEASQDTVRYVGQTDQFPVEMSRSSCGDAQEYVDREHARVVQLDMEGLYLVSFTRSPSALRLGLTEGPYLKLCRERLAAQGHEYELATGAKIFCEPDQYAATRVAVKHLECTFRPYHVVATEKHLPSVLYTVRSFPHSLKVKVKSSRLIAYIGRSEETQRTTERARKQSTRYSGSGPQVDNPQHSSTMPLFVQLAPKADAAEDQEEFSADAPLLTAPPISEFQQPYVEPLQPGHPYWEICRPKSCRNPADDYELRLVSA
jgi:hypothetical protein